jgi:hypothetical protein
MILDRKEKKKDDLQFGKLFAFRKFLDVSAGKGNPSRGDGSE